MEKVGIRDLRLNLSRYLKEVKKGRQLLITERGRIIARILPVAEDDDERRVLLELADRGYVRLPGQWMKPAGRPERVRVQGSPLSQAVIEDRR